MTMPRASDVSPAQTIGGSVTGRPEAEPRIDSDENIRAIIARYPSARQVLDRYGLMNCGGAAGPDEPLGSFAQVHHVPLDALLRDLAAAIATQRTVQVASSEAAAPRESSGHFTPFLLAALGLTLTFGATLGMINLARLTAAWGWGALTPPSIWMHAYVQVFGFVGLFIMGVAYHVVPRFTGTSLRAPGLVTPSFWLQLGGVVSIVCGFWLVPPARAFWLGGSLALVGAAALFAASIGLTLAASTSGPEHFKRWIGAGLVWALVTALLVVVAAITNDPIWHAALWPIALYGLAANWIFGIGHRIFPIFLGLRSRSPVFGLPTFVAYQVGVALWSAGALRTLSWLRIPGGVLLVVAVAAYLGALGVLRGDESSPTRVERWFRSYIGASWLWLAVGLAAGPLWSTATLLRGGYESVIMLDFARHAVAFGFVTQTIMGVMSRVLPVFTGIPFWSVRARTASFVLLNLSVAIRGLEVVVVTGLWPGAWSLIALSGPPAVGAVLLFAANVVMTLRGRPAQASRPATDGDLADLPVLTLLQIPGALELLVGAGFTPLANPVLRATVARNVTLRQACTLKSVPLPPLLEQLAILRASAKSEGDPADRRIAGLKSRATV